MTGASAKGDGLGRLALARGQFVCYNANLYEKCANGAPFV